MWLNDVPFNGTLLSQNGHLIRFLVQCVLILITLWLAEFFKGKFIKGSKEKMS